MKLKYFSLFLLFLLGMHGAIAKGSISNLPAPGNLVNTVNEPTFVAFTFSPVQGATGYQVEITYPSGAAGQTFQLNDPNTSSFSATTLNESMTVSIAAMEDDEVSLITAMIMIDKIIIMDIVAGLSPIDEKGSVLCQHGELPLAEPLICFTPSEENQSFVFEFKEGNEIVQLKWTNKIIAGTSKRKIEAQLCTTESSGWFFYDDCTNVIAGPTAVCNVSETLYLSKSYRSGDIVKIRIKGTPQTDVNRIHIAREGSNQTLITNIKISKHVAAPRSDNQSTQSSNEYKVTPNPFSDYLNIAIDTPEKGEVVVNLFDVTGSLHKSVTLPANELDNQNYTIATSDLLSGMYIMQVRTSAGVQQVSKVFKL